MRYPRYIRLTGLVLAACAGCSSSNDSTGTPTPSTDAGADTAPSVPSVTDKGTVVDFNSKKGFAGVTVTEGGKTTTTAADGTWSLVVPKDTPLLLSLSKDAPTTAVPAVYVPESYIEIKLTKDGDRGPISLVPTDTYDLVTGSFDNFDKTHGLLYVEIAALPSCTSYAGATVRLATPGSAIVRYVKNGLPLASATGIDPKEAVPALFYNVDLETPLDVVVENTTCTQVPFPYTDDALGATYTGNVQVHGAASSVARYFLK